MVVHAGQVTRVEPALLIGAVEVRTLQVTPEVGARTHQQLAGVTAGKPADGDGVAKTIVSNM